MAQLSSTVQVILMQNVLKIFVSILALPWSMEGNGQVFGRVCMCVCVRVWTLCAC